MESPDNKWNRLFVTGGGLLGDAPDENALLGERLGAFELVDVIGRGGLSVVYLAERRDRKFDQRAAVKILSHLSPGLVARFEQERQILARLDHPAIARIYDGGTLPDGRPYLIMEYVAGDPLDQHCRRQELSLRARLDLFEQIAEAVRVAHEEGVVHHDLKPDNVLVDRHGHAKLLDFGIARLLTEPGERRSLDLMTPRYAAPEQFDGQPAGVATDVFQLGLVLYGLVSDRPAAGDTTQADVLRERVRNLPVVPLSRLGVGGQPRPDRELDAIIDHCLAPAPEHRYADAGELLRDLRAWRRGQATSVGQSPARLFLRRHRVALPAGVLALAAVGFVGYSVFDAYERERERSARMQELATHVLSDTEESADRITNLSFEISEGAMAEDPELERQMALLNAEALLRNGQPEAAIEMVEAVLGRSMGGFEASAADAPLFAILGQAYLRAGDAMSAARHLDAAIGLFGPEASPGPQARVHEYRAAIHVSDGNADAALGHLNQAIGLAAPGTDHRLRLEEDLALVTAWAESGCSELATLPASIVGSALRAQCQPAPGGQ